MGRIKILKLIEMSCDLWGIYRCAPSVCSPPPPALSRNKYSLISWNMWQNFGLSPPGKWTPLFGKLGPATEDHTVISVM